MPASHDWPKKARNRDVKSFDAQQGGATTQRDLLASVFLLRSLGFLALLTLLGDHLSKAAFRQQYNVSPCRMAGDV